MPKDRPLTSDEIDDGWCLDEEPAEPPESEYHSYDLVVGEEEDVPSSGFEEAYWERGERRRLKRRFGDDSPFFGTVPMRVSERQPRDREE